MRALIVVDVQNDFVTGSLGSEEAVSKLPQISKRIADYVASGDIVVFTKDTHDENYLNTAEGRKLPYPDCIKNTEG
jgi:nicotinamidase-related amidase